MMEIGVGTGVVDARLPFVVAEGDEGDVTFWEARGDRFELTDTPTWHRVRFVRMCHGRLSSPASMEEAEATAEVACDSCGRALSTVHVFTRADGRFRVDEYTEIQAQDNSRVPIRFVPRRYEAPRWMKRECASHEGWKGAVTGAAGWWTPSDGRSIHWRCRCGERSINAGRLVDTAIHGDKTGLNPMFGLVRV